MGKRHVETFRDEVHQKSFVMEACVLGSIDRSNSSRKHNGLKPSELAPASSSLLENGIPTYLDTKAFRVIEGGPAVGEQIWHQKRDKILFKRMQAYNTFMSCGPTIK
ncbi:hypothetical protein CUMW_102440 [Citrus unshiu]|nr:hypothetical protein CUMW_102440 [Citrus unshiu]